MSYPVSFTQMLPDGTFFEMVLVQGGTFWMGDDSEHMLEWEGPPRAVRVDSFYLSRYPLIQGLLAPIGFHIEKLDFAGKCLPVHNISWYDAKEITALLSSISKRNYRLPYEAEWEYAARGGLFSEGYRCAGSDKLLEVAWVHENSRDEMHAVGLKLANELGLFDMNGNVFEWCEDDFRYDAARSALSEPLRPHAEADKVYRGGAWTAETAGCHSAARRWLKPRSSPNFIGMRVALSVESAAPMAS